jgi:uncharacterized protein YutE (UPF0331/DUF86 family)
MSHLSERLAELVRHLDHLRELRPSVPSSVELRRNLSLHNDVLYSLLTVCQLVIDIAGELSARRGLRFEDYTEAVRNLAQWPQFPKPMLRTLEKLPGFRNILIHEYVALDMDRVINALDQLQPVADFAELVRRLEAERP